jgi:hypothetical protein
MRGEDAKPHHGAVVLRQLAQLKVPSGLIAVLLDLDDVAERPRVGRARKALTSGPTQRSKVWLRVAGSNSIIY